MPIRDSSGPSGEAPAPTPAPSPFDLPVQLAPRPPEVTVEAEIEALRQCVHALQPVSYDRAVLRRIYDYLQQRFPATKPVGRNDL